MRLFLMASFLLCSSLLHAQSENDAAEKAWARKSKEIAFQNDSQWQDSRWQQTDVGPFLAGSIRTPNRQVVKGLAIRVGATQQAAVCYDTARMTLAAGWTGEFLQFGPRRFGLIEPPRVAGDVAFNVPPKAGWAYKNRFDPRPDELTDVDLEARNMKAGDTIACLPKHWIDYRGHFTHGERVVLAYDVQGVSVLESPWFVEADGAAAFVRSFEIAGADEPMQLWAADEKSIITLRGGNGHLSIDNAQPVVHVAPRRETIRFDVLLTSGKLQKGTLEALMAAISDSAPLSEWTETDEGRFPQVLETVGETTETGGPYRIDTVTLPFDNPFNALLFTAGHDFYSDGRAAVCMAHGDVWTVAGIDRELRSLKWRRFATGLHQPLGLRIVDDVAYVICKSQIVRLNDRNDDGEADFYECFNNGIMTTRGAHDYITCLDTGPDGSFYFIHARTGVMRVSPDGETIESVAFGFRNPNGMGVSPDGMITAAPQQGSWTPESCVIAVREGGYYGFGGPRVTEDRPSGWELPLCFIPRAMDNSGGAQVWVEGDRWGPVEGQMLHLSFGQCRPLMVLTEEIGDRYQGGAINLPTTPGDFESGIMRGRFSPHDGQLYVSGLRGWQTRAIRDGCFQRLRYAGGPVHMPVAVKTYANGLALTFTEPLAAEMANDPDNFFAEEWNYLWSSKYGSPDFSVSQPDEQGRDEVTVVSSTLLEDRRTIFLEMPDRKPVHQIQISWLLADDNGESFQGTYAHTINQRPGELFAEDHIVRKVRRPRISPELEQRLQRGVAMTFQNRETDEADSRIARLLALRHDLSTPATPFIAAGPIDVRATGTMQVSLSGFSEFRIRGRGTATLTINGDVVAKLPPDETVRSDRFLLRKGHNPFLLEFASADRGVAHFEVEWKGDNFGWEPIPAANLFHDSGHDALVAASGRRLGRELFADHQCVRCHRSGTDPLAMFETHLTPPSFRDTNRGLDNRWLQAWLTDPHKLRPDTTMPAMLGDGAEAAQAAADLAAFLTTLGENAPQSTQPTAEDVEAGGALYETLGCVACHTFETAVEPDPYDRVSLHFTNAKYQFSALPEFLKNPSANHPSIRMPDFALNAAEAAKLAAYIRSESTGELKSNGLAGDAVHGKKLFESVGCRECHQIDDRPLPVASRGWNDVNFDAGCLRSDTNSTTATTTSAPDFRLRADEVEALRRFLKRDLESLAVRSEVETSRRLVSKLRCTSCHDRDGERAIRLTASVEEGSGLIPETIPSLSWAGERFHSRWTETLLSGDLSYKSRPWLKARMPAFSAYANALSQGLAAEHAVSPTDDGQAADVVDVNLAKIGESLTLKSGLDCRQCHGVGKLEPRGDEKTKVALGVNFEFVRDRLRRDSYHRFMLDPPRYDINTRMIKLSADGLTTKLKQPFDADAHQQFEAVWHYIQSLPKRGSETK